MYFALVGDVAFRVKSRVGRLIGSCGDLERGSVIAEVCFGMKLDVIHGSCEEGQSQTKIG